MIEGIYDIHTHILPNVDDGSKSFEESIDILKKEYQGGVRTIFATSHYRKGMFEPELAKIIRQYQILCGVAKKILPDLKIVLGCEFHACENMVAMLDQHLRPTLGDSNYVLVEFSSLHNYDYLYKKCYELIVGGYQPIIAHIERYPALFDHLERVNELRQMGALIQMNADAILGKNGLKYKLFAKKVIHHDMLDFVGSDVHNTQERSTHIGECAEYLAKKMGEAYARRIFIENPSRI